MKCRTQKSDRRHLVQRQWRRGFTLTEIMVVLAIMAIMFRISAPTFSQSIQQSKADIAGANLRGIWSAQRLYWLEFRSYATDLSELVDEDLLDPTILSLSGDYEYGVSEADSTSFTADASRIGSDKWSGRFTIDEAGAVLGVVEAAKENDITPGFL